MNPNLFSRSGQNWPEHQGSTVRTSIDLAHATALLSLEPSLNHCCATRFSPLPDCPLKDCIRWTRRNLRWDWVFNIWWRNADVGLWWRRIVLRQFWLVGIFDPRKSRHGRRFRWWHNDWWIQIWNDQHDRQGRMAQRFKRKAIFKWHGDLPIVVTFQTDPQG
jgi:hypothetical protein